MIHVCCVAVATFTVLFGYGFVNFVLVWSQDHSIIDFAQVAKIWNEGSQNPARTPNSRADLLSLFLSYINVDSMPWTICVRCTYCALSTRAHLLLTFIDFAQVAKIWNEGSQNPARTPNSHSKFDLTPGGKLRKKARK